jgi:hypothetical protein
MRYAAVLDGDERAFELIAPCFNADEAKFVKFDGMWTLESSSFNACKLAQDVSPLADALVLRILHVLSIYVGLHFEVAVLHIQTFDDMGNRAGRGIRGTATINI